MKKSDKTKQFKRNAKLAKRKAKMAKDRRRSVPAQPSLLYRGNRYKTDEFTELTYATESGVFKAFVDSGETLRDQQVRAALECLIVRIRRGELPVPTEVDCDAPDAEREAIVAAIVESWETLTTSYPKEAMIGVLRTLLSSVEIWSVQSANARGYLEFLEGFLGKVAAAR